MSPLSRYFGLIYTLIISRERSAASVADTVHPNIPSSSQAVKRGCNNFYPPVTCPRENVVYAIYFLHCLHNVGISWKKLGGLLIQLTRSLKFNVFYLSFQEPDPLFPKYLKRLLITLSLTGHWRKVSSITRCVPVFCLFFIPLPGFFEPTVLVYPPTSSPRIAPLCR